MSIHDRFSAIASFFSRTLRHWSAGSCSRLAVALPLGLALVGVAPVAHAETGSPSERGSDTHLEQSPAAPTATPTPTATPKGTAAENPQQTLVVYKTPTCGCCGKWIEHLEAAGFRVEATNLPDLTELKALNGVPSNLGSCHTALVEGYVIEGHVPASDIRKLLEQRPKVAGLAVPGMPLGSPGMEHRDPRRHEAYDVLSFGAGGVKVFSSHHP